MSLNPGDTRGLLGSHLNELVQYPKVTVHKYKKPLGRQEPCAIESECGGRSSSVQ